MFSRTPRAQMHSHDSRPRQLTLVVAQALLLMTAGATALVASPAIAQSRDAVVTYRIAAGPLAAALASFGQASGAMIAYTATDVASRSTQGLNGSYTVGAGLTALLAGSGLQAVREDNGGYTLRVASAAPAIAQLAPLTVTGVGDATVPAPYAGGQVATGGRVGLLGNRDFMETPFSTVSYTESFILDKQAQDISSVIAATDPSVHVSGSTGMINESYSIRGFGVSSGDVALGGLYGMIPYWRTTPELAERIEVLKGPSALLNGMPPGGSVGGSINLVPKRAGSEPLTRVAATYASDAQVGGHLDMSRRFGERQEFGIRFNGVYRDGDSATQHQSKQSRLAALALDWRGERVRLSADLYQARDLVEGVNRGITLGPGMAVPTPPKPDTLLNPPWTYTDTKDKAAILRGEFDVSDAITAYAAVGRSKMDFDSLASSTQVLLNPAGDLRNNATQQRIHYDRSSAEIGVKARFDTGPIRHEAALTATQYSHDYYFSRFNNLLAQDWISNIYHPTWGPAPDTSANSKVSLPKTGEVRMRSVGVADTLSFADGAVQLTVGIRRQEVRSDTFNATTGALTTRYDEAAVTPAVAVLVRANDMLSVYGNYIEGLSQGETAPTSAANAGEVFAPYKTRQAEVGLKADLGRYSATLSAFQIKRPSSYTDPVSNIFSFSGEQRNRGLELSFFGEAMPGLRVMGGISYTKAELTKTANGVNQGKRATNLPTWQAKLGVDWDVPGVQGLSLNGNMVTVSEKYITADNSMSVPGRTVFDVGARYRTALAGRPVVLRGTVQNVTNKAYWAGTLGTGLGAPRTFLLSASMDF